MDESENASVVRRAFDAWQTGTAPITDLFAPDMTWRNAIALTALRVMLNGLAFRCPLLPHAPIGSP